MDETTPLLQVPSQSSSYISENEIVSYVQQRRLSIASSGTGRIHRVFSIPSYEPILEPARSDDSSISHSIYDIVSAHSEIGPEPITTVRNEVVALIRSSAPLVITFLLQYSLTVASVFSVGRIGSTELAAVSLSSMTANISGYAIIQGNSTCLDTLCAQAYGRKDFNLVGVHFMRCNWLLLLLCLPIMVFWVWGVEPLLFRIVGDESREVCILAAKYLRILSMGLPGFILFENGKHFLQSQGIFESSTYVLFICAPLNAFLNYLLVWDPKIGLGFIGAPISVVITNWMMFILLYAYIFLINGKECWPSQSPIHRIHWTRWEKMIELAIPGVLMVEAEWLAFEIITFSAAKLGTKVLAAQSIISTTCVLLYQIPFALSIAASTRVAWFVGAASEKTARTATTAALYTALTFGVMNCSILFFFRWKLASLYTNEKDVITLAAKVLIVGSIYQINDFISCATAGVLRGQGRQIIGGITNVVGYYLLALPCAFVFAFKLKLGLLGLWFGMIIALMFVSLVQLYFVLISDWEQIIRDSISEGIAEDGNLHIEALPVLPSMSNSVIN
ncbi:uncharacterized protein J8A68_005088 [[Candida] subhashii]|uniref:Uncharacterized protein n=1 Tax=[Candida] subhashii TaxID=561895 RepID=A0A8J5QFY6_9ASCO|nr:uncharacterized protein J8A68_005088 [[Candida] subhashii]KAG7661393.1 hypothetical protein J8A68_005088 [[Candida] subhashii]